MRTTSAVMFAVAVAMLLINVGPADAQNYPWCAQRADGAVNCGFVSYEQCRMAGSWCNRNPMYRPPAGEPRRRTDGRHG
jgi:Protein of unknown function (DUF3551)